MQTLEIVFNKSNYININQPRFHDNGCRNINDDDNNNNNNNNNN